MAREDLDQNIDLVVFVLDETGSMAGATKATVDGFNAYVDELKKIETPTYFTLIKFSNLRWKNRDADTVRLVLDAVPLSQVPRLSLESYSADGDTPLYDAVGKGLRIAEEQAKRVEATRILFTVLTDGLENCSSEFKAADVKKEVEQRTERGNWTITYLGANQDAWAVGATMGVARGNAMTYTADSIGMSKTMRAYATVTNSTRVSEQPATLDSFAGASLSDYDNSPVDLVPGDITPGDNTKPEDNDE